MSLMKLQFRPGINRDVTAYAGEGGWHDGDKIRFRSGFPESIGGWTRLTDTAFLGACRKLHPWTTLSGQSLIFLGTNLHTYINRGGGLFDITPIRLTTTGTATISATDGSNVITITDNASNCFLNDFVIISGAASLGGNITADVLNTEHQITRVISGNEYEITLGVTANASDTGNGGGSTQVEYEISVGLDTSVVGAGWGADTWSAGGWGDPASTTVSGAQLRVFGADNFGEDLIFNVHDGGIFYWDASSGLNARAVALEDLAGANSVPTVAKNVMISDRDRHIIALGCDGEFTPGVEDPLLIRFSSQESATDWETRADNTAGSLRISTGSEIITSLKTKQQILIWTDVSLHTMQFIGPPFTFGLNEVSSNVSIMSHNAAVAVNDSAYWMGKREFYIYNGTASEIPCSVLEYVFDDFNDNQSEKVFAAHNSEHSEIWWFYPSSSSDNLDRYVVYNYGQQIWYYGVLERTAWIARGVFPYPIAASLDGYLYYHEYGLNDGSQNPPVGIDSYIESSPIDIGDGDRFMLVQRIIPDITFRSSTGTPSVDFTLKAQDYPGNNYSDTVSRAAIRSATVPIEQYTPEQFVRIRGRSIAVRVESDQLNTAWRLGAPRIDMRPDGRR